ncbi:ribosome small subunit-dependent GTPase A [soil metagenome]
MTSPNEVDAPYLDGRVLRSTGSWYDVALVESGERIRARVRGKFRLEAEMFDETNPVAVGDEVMLLMGEDGTGMIMEIKPRFNKLTRRAAGRRSGREQVIVANVDFAWCVQSVYLPKFNSGFVDRFLTMAEVYDVPAGIIINKADLLDNERAEEVIGFWAELYDSLEYPVLLTSTKDGSGIEALREMLAGRTSVLSGPSGVGKSTLLNTIDPSLDLRTGEISEKSKKGKHTTTFATLFPLFEGGFVVDTPGIREYGIWELEPAELGGYFVEMQPLVEMCHYPSCTHDHEPGCAVTDAVDDGRISPERYDSYLSILASLRAGTADRGR